MSFFGRISLGVFALAVLIAISGCMPTDSSRVDEEREPHFVLGNSRFNEMDWNGAIEAFQESLEVNPHSAQAHYRLAQLFDTKEPDPAAAIYHYEQYLKLEPDAKNRDVINHRIYSCKQQLASDVMQLPSAPAVQKQLDTLVQQNRQLQAQVDQLNGIIKQWNAYYISQQAALRTANSSAQNPSGAQTSNVQRPEPAAGIMAGPQKTVAPGPQRPRTHVVVSGETLVSIARKYNLRLASLEAANRGVNPRKLHVGQSLNLPP